MQGAERPTPGKADPVAVDDPGAIHVAAGHVVTGVGAAIDIDRCTIGEKQSTRRCRSELAREIRKRTREINQLIELHGGESDDDY